MWNDGTITLLFMVVLYLLPTIVAWARHSTQTAPIVVVNLFLGWTFIGWVGALAWAVGSSAQVPHGDEHIRRS